MRATVAPGNRVSDWLRRLRGVPLPGARVVRACERLGTGYGGAVISPAGLDRQSVVYSAGVGEDISFDLALIQRYGVTVHAFDPTPRSIEWVRAQRLPAEFVMHEYGLAARDGLLEFTPPRNPRHVSHTILAAADRGHAPIRVPVRSLPSIMAELGHDHIDLLKLDIEGAEFEVLEQLLVHGLDVRQIAVEFHHRFLGRLGFRRTEHVIGALNRAGYRACFVSREGKDFCLVR